MIKVFHVIAIGALISSAMYAYTIKYETLYHGEQLTKLKQHVQKEREAIAVLKAEWQHLNRPDRLQMLSERHLSLQPLVSTQLARFADIPGKGPKVDGIGQKLEALGLMRDDAPTASIVRPAPRVPVAATPRPVQPRAATAAASRPAAITPRQTAASQTGPRQLLDAAASSRPVPPRSVPVMASATASTTTPRPPMRLQQ
jgi:hypothetical protein